MEEIGKVSTSTPNETVYTLLYSSTGEPTLTTSIPLISPSHHFSLDEHSYCATLSSVPNHHHHHDILAAGNETLEGSKQLLTSSSNSSGADLVIPSNELPGDDVNFDGFTFTIPIDAQPIGGGTESENLWSFVNGIPVRVEDNLNLPAGINTIEVTSIEEVNGTGSSSTSILNDSLMLNEVEIIGEIGQKVDPKLTDRQSTAKCRLNRSRREDFIDDTVERETYLKNNYEKIAEQLAHVISRTGCEGKLSAIYEGKRISDLAPTANICTINYETHETRPVVANSTDDHPYAATILTQNISSTGVQDHQYVEKTIPSAQGSDIDFDDDSGSSSSSSTKRKGVEQSNQDTKSKYKKFEYIDIGWQRDQAFCRTAKSMFTQKCRLENRTGAMISLVLTYGGCTVNKKNFRNCSSVIALNGSSQRAKEKKLEIERIKKNRQLLKPLALAPRPELSVPISFILPVETSPQCPSQKDGLKFTKHMSPSPENIKFHQQQSDRQKRDQSLEDCEMAEGAAPVCSRFQESEVPENLSNFVDASSEMESESSTESVHSPVHSTMSAPCVTSVKDSFTNTESICSICHNEETENDSSNFWIRCNDPFCYYMVHTSCVGFMVNHASHLKQLPTFYCRRHR